jgi:GntR family transcriptional regulator
LSEGEGGGTSREGVISDPRHEARRGYVGRSYLATRGARRLSIGVERQPQADGGGNNQDRDADDKPAVSLAPLSLSNHELLWSTRHRPRLGPRLCRRHNSDTLAVTMMEVKLRRNDSLPLHDQVAAEIRRDIANGDVKPGQRLPPAKDMAAVLGVHPNTVFRALRLLRDEGVLEFCRGRGVTVIGTPEKSALLSQVRELVDFGRRQGYQRQEIIDMIQAIPS